MDTFDPKSVKLVSSLPNDVTIEMGGINVVVSLHDLRRALTIEHIARLVIDWMNGHGSPNDARKLAGYVCQSHRTLQQSFIRFFLTCLISIPTFTGPYGTDARNETGIALCRVMEEDYGGTHLPYI